MMVRVVWVALFQLPLSANAGLYYPCWTADYAWKGSTLSEALSVQNATDCQLIARSQDKPHFTWDTLTSKCYVGGLELEYKPNSLSGPSTSNCQCPGTMPRNGPFPGANVRESHAAWVSGFQPTPLSCWPTSLTPQACENPSTLFDMWQDESWGGECADDMENKNAVDMADCQKQCKENPNCAVWQYSSGQSRGVCKHGEVGFKCQVRNKDSGLLGAQRILHGRVRVLKKMTTYRVPNLKLVFENTYYSDQQVAIRDCQYTCYSSIWCQYWQYIPAKGCYVEVPRGGGSNTNAAAPYPLYTAYQGVVVDTIADGEFVQHWCLTPRDATPARGMNYQQHQNGRPVVPGKGVSSAGASVVGALLMCCSGSIMFCYWLRHKKKEPKKKAKTRALTKFEGQTPSVKVVTTAPMVPTVQYASLSTPTPMFTTTSTAAPMFTRPSMGYGRVVAATPTGSGSAFQVYS